MPLIFNILIKRKSILVILLSSFVISFVFIITLIGFYVYLNWKEENLENLYSKNIHELNVKLYEEYITISSVRLGIGDKGIFKNKAFVEGHIKNKSNKKIISLKLKISLLDKEGRVMYMDAFYPLKPDSHFGILPQETGNYLSPSDSVSFKHLLKNCHKDIMGYLRMKNKFAKEKSKEYLNINYKIEEIALE